MDWKSREINSLEKNIINLVIQSVEKIIKIKLQEDDEVILNVLKEALNKFTFTHKLIIRVDKDSFDLVNSSKNKILAMTDNIDDIEVKIDSSFQKGDIVIDTDSGTINPSIKNQIGILKEEFIKLLQGDD
ncbi:FliH/SctL family protein [Alkalithermobacter paradoxus]|uniref:Flagellar assembly protein H n=1 Tax=Alkalithermobacter paradoxus TaxID=29349 RepID=A0A1V4IAX5_9FIRM|nr:flagellar assembly protein H [[Clostridium] thermoalcaliphilum]